MKLKTFISVVLMTVLTLVAAGCNREEEEVISEPVADSINDSTVIELTAENPWEATVKGDGSLDRVKNAGTIIIGLEKSNPPMEFYDIGTDKMIGFDIEMAELIGEKLGVKLEFVSCDKEKMMSSLKEKNFDVVISGMYMWDSRIDEVNFVPYGFVNQVLLVRADAQNQNKMTNIHFFKDKIIGAQLDSIAVEYLQNMDFVETENLLCYETLSEAVGDLDNGKINALAIDNFNAVDLLNSGKYVNIGAIKSSEGKMADCFGIAFRKNDGDLQLAIQKAVDELIISGELKEVSIKWMGFDITEPLVEDSQARLDANVY